MARKILIVDDDPDFKEAITTLLETKGYTIVAASNGKDGIARAKAERPALILLDVMMTHKTEGFDIARQLHDDPDLNGIPVIMMTGIRKDMNLSFGFEADADWLPVKTVLEKPVKPDVLLAEVQKYLK